MIEQLLYIYFLLDFRSIQSNLILQLIVEFVFQQLEVVIFFYAYPSLKLKIPSYLFGHYKTFLKIRVNERMYDQFDL